LPANVGREPVALGIAWRKPSLDHARYRRYDPFVADLNQAAARLVKRATDPDERSETAAQTNGCRGGLKGGKAAPKSCRRLPDLQGG
jgi:hypothetical protein